MITISQLIIVFLFMLVSVAFLIFVYLFIDKFDDK